ncbi:MAG: hypothetical protein KDA37_09860, partial [Planctomycetales bacterium]|nr:hypothetical protein [Planctomycetales bacterium]
AGVLLLVFAAPVEGLIATEFSDNPDGLAVGFITSFLWCAFSLAVFFTTVLRHAIYAALLSFGVAISTMVSITSRTDRWLESWGCVILLVMAVAATLNAWACYRKDWALRN